MIDDVLRLSRRQDGGCRARLRGRMQEASGTLAFERAAQLRDALKWLDQVEQPQAVEVVGGGHADAIGFARDGDDACGVILRIRDGRVIAREHRFLENVEPESDGAILSAFLVRFYLPLEQRADRVLMPFAPDDIEALHALVSGVDCARAATWDWRQAGRAGGPERAASAREPDDRGFDIEERAADPVYALGRDLGLTVVPRSFVCIDISTNQGRDTVGSLVWFEAGRPKKSEYRRFKIKAPAQRDDYAAIHEVVTRYLTRRQNENKQLPDLMVIDGGKGQLGAALEAARLRGARRFADGEPGEAGRGDLSPGTEPSRSSCRGAAHRSSSYSGRATRRIALP